MELPCLPFMPVEVGTPYGLPGLNSSASASTVCLC